DVWASMVWVAVIIAALIYSLSTSLQNVAAWFQIIFSQPYKIGDIIEMGDIRGYVVDVSLSSTMVREMGNWVNGDLYTGRFVTIPNRMILEKGVANYTRHNKFIYEYLAVSLTYESDIARGEAVLLDIVREVLGSADVDFVKATKDAETKELVRAMPKKPRVFWQSRDSGVELGVLYMVTMHDRFYMRSEITKRFLSAVKEEPCLSIAYPHVEVVRHEQPDHNKEIA
ncbi:MAG: mechanosensitive ion channel, partial [Thermoplasmata archaeon]|nr:mechanosensitive ion channel [Thermoplasmata archaeon]